jgi:hypothetical protein
MQAIAKEETTALAGLGRCYEHGEGVLMSKNKAVLFYQRGAAAKNSEAIMYLGIYLRAVYVKCVLYACVLCLSVCVCVCVYVCVFMA